MIRFFAGPEAVTGNADFDTEAERDAFVARFPKYVGLRPGLLYGKGDTPRPLASLHITLASNGVNGGVNETGLKRLRKLLELLDDSEIEIRRNTGPINTLDDLKGLVN